MRKRYIHHYVTLASTNSGLTDRQHTPIGCLRDLPWPKMQLGEYLFREALPLPHPFVTAKDAGYRRVGRVTPFDRWIEKGQDPLDATGLESLVTTAHEID